VSRFNQMTVVAISDCLGFGLGFEGCGLGLEVMALALGVEAMLTSLFHLWSGCWTDQQLAGSTLGRCIAVQRPWACRSVTCPQHLWSYDRRTPSKLDQL